jgi:hypothetical protein
VSRRVRFILSCGCPLVVNWVWPEDPVVGVETEPCPEHRGRIRLAGFEWLEATG